MDLPEIERRLGDVLRDASSWLPPEQIAEMSELVQAGEPGVALENLCTQLEEYDVRVPPNVVGELRALAMAMGLELSAWIDRIVEKQ